ncbi:hypothetical protein XM79_u0052 [Vibrio vulnificus]|nr:hypothetical protein XM79_u0052 [Vibrio vulnificus]
MPSNLTVGEAEMNFASASMVPDATPFLSPPASPVLFENVLPLIATLLPPSIEIVVVPPARSTDLMT